MDPQKKDQTQPTQGHQGQQRADRDQNWSGQAPERNRDQAEGEREQTRGGSSSDDSTDQSER